MTWEIWWMLGSAGVALVGFLGRQAIQFFVGAKTIIQRDEEAPDYSVVEEQVLSGRTANREFKDHVSTESLKTRAGSLFFWLLCIGLVTHAAFWVYAALYLND